MMDEIAETLKKMKEMGDVDIQFLNCEEAKQFISSCSDPIMRELLWTAYSVLTFRMASAELVGKFDVFFFIRVVSEMAKDRGRLIRLLAGDHVDD